MEEVKTTELDDLKVKFNAQPGTIDGGMFKKLAAWIDLNTARYENISVTEETLPQVKKDLAEMRKKFDALETERKVVKNTWEAPYKAWEAEYKQAVSKLTGLIESVATKQRELESTLEEARVNDIQARVLADANNRRNGLAKIIHDNPALWARVWKDSYGNKSASLNKITLEWRQAINAVTEELEICESSRDADTMVALFLYTGTLSAAMARHSKLNDMKATAEVAPVIPPQTDDRVVSEKPSMDVVEYHMAIAANPTEADLKPAVGRRAFRGPKYKVLALLEFAEVLGIEMEKIQ